MHHSWIIFLAWYSSVGTWDFPASHVWLPKAIVFRPRNARQAFRDLDLDKDGKVSRSPGRMMTSGGFFWAAVGCHGWDLKYGQTQDVFKYRLGYHFWYNSMAPRCRYNAYNYLSHPITIHHYWVLHASTFFFSLHRKGGGDSRFSVQVTSAENDAQKLEAWKW